MQLTDPTAAALMDQRDQAIDDLAKLIPIKVTIEGANTATVTTTSGVSLVSMQAAHLTFNSPGTLNANTLYDPDPTQSGVGTLMISFPGGSQGDFLAMGKLVTGRIAADIQLRDDTLVQAQTQLDQMASALAGAISDVTTNGTAVSAPPQNGFDLNVASMLPGNSVDITYTDTATNTQRRIKIVRVDDPAALPLATPGPTNEQMVGIDFTSGMASVVSQLNTALGTTNLQFSNTGSVLHVLDNGLGAATVNAASVTTTTSVLANGALQLPLFTDGGSLYTGTITSAGSQMTGFAGRITVNPALVADPTKFSIYNTAPLTNSGDTGRSDFLFTQMTTTQFTFSPATGLGSASTPFQGTLNQYLQQFITLQGNAAANAKEFADGQEVVVSNLQTKASASSKVSVDSEMANLIALQSAYAANAHVMATVQQMMQSLIAAQG
jgi:flagellar hook-associated protein 1 FlgK